MTDKAVPAHHRLDLARRRGGALRGAVAVVAMLGGAGLLVYGLAAGHRTVTVEQETKIFTPPKPPDPRLVDACLRRGLPPPPGEPARTQIKTIYTPTPVPEWRLVRGVTAGALRLEPDGLHQMGLDDGPALCPT